VKGGLYEGAAIDAATVKKLALMPTRDEALSMFLGYLNSVLSGFAGLLDARKVQLEAAAPAADNATENSSNG
jgi:large subunit ribosomal protein L10